MSDKVKPIGGREKTKYIGIYQRQLKNKDIAYEIMYRINGKVIRDIVGLKSKDCTPQIANEIRIGKIKEIRKIKNTYDLPAEYIKKKIPSFAECWQTFWETKGNFYKEKATIEGRWRNHIKPHFGNHPINQITPKDLESFKNKLLTKLSPKTVLDTLGLMGRVYETMDKLDVYTGPNPLKKVDKPKVDNARQRYLTEDEAILLLNALNKYEITWHFAVISLYTGARLSEILNLKWADIDFNSQYFIARYAKTGTRIVSFDQETKNIFISWRAKQAELKQDKSGIVFPSHDGTYRKSQNSTTTYRRVVDKLGFNENVVDEDQKVCFHTLRHTFASWLVMDGTPIYTVQKLLGHKTSQMTNRYAHLDPKVQQDALRVISEKMRRISKL